jgi:hypothetical protein
MASQFAWIKKGPPSTVDRGPFYMNKIIDPLNY